MIGHDIPLPKLLNSSLGSSRTIFPIRVSLNLSITPLSYASIELPVGESLPARSYVQVYSPLGFAGIFRVRSPQEAYGDDIAMAELEHAISEVGDFIVDADIKEMKSASAAMRSIFNYYKGSKWQLGSVSAMGTGQIAVQANHDKVLQVMISLLEQCPSCMMAFDFSTIPWTVNIVKRGTTVTAEGRLSRNVDHARITYDDTELCTRAWYEHGTIEDAGTDNFLQFKASERYGKGTYLAHSGKLYQLTADHDKGVTWANTQKKLIDDMPTSVWAYMDADTIGTYGIIERPVNTGSDYTQAEAQRVVTEFLNKHKTPRFSVEIGAEELSNATGESLDNFTIGKLFRLVLADYGNVTVEEVITQVSWNDVYGKPEDMTVNLAEEEDTAITFLHDVDTTGGSGGGGGAKKKQEEKFKEYQTKFEKDDWHLRLVAQRLKTAEDVLQQAGLYIDANGVLIYAEDNERQLAGKIKVQADRISLVVEGTGENAKIKPAAIVASINEQTGTSIVKISADVIDIDGILNAIATQSKVVRAGEVSALSSFDSPHIHDEGGFLRFSGSSWQFGVNQWASWKTKTVVTGVSYTHPKVTFSAVNNFLYSNTVGGTTAAGTVRGHLTTGYVNGAVTPTTETIYYLGRDASS